MEQRPLRLGDIVDDYCPRERRITNHVIVAIVGESIRQTRCQTCDSDHVYKEARVPRRKKKDDTSVLYDQVLADAGGGQLVPARPADEQADMAADMANDQPARMAADATDNGGGTTNGDESPGAEAQEEHEGQSGPGDIWPAHRPLIRATLPRTENDPPVARPIPEFTMHQRQAPPHRGGFRYGGWQGGNGGGQPSRHGGGRPNRPGGDGNVNGNGPGNAQPGPGGRKSGRHRGGKHRRPR